LNAIADKQAYRFTRDLYSIELNDRLVRAKLVELFDPEKFLALELRFPDHSVVVGEVESDAVSISRPLIIHDVGHSHEHLSYDLLLYHPPMEQLVKNAREKTLFFIGVPFLLFGAILASIIHLIVIRPIKEMVVATHKVCEGDMSIRLNSNRIDEFGELQDFFNRMLDKLEESHIELKDAFENADSANKAKSAFLANMSHELRTPLNAILGYTDLVRETLEDAGIDQCKSDTDRIINAASHLLALINEVLDLSKIESGNMELHIEEFSLGGLIEDVIVTTKPLIEENRNVLIKEIDADLGRIHTDQTKVYQILLNLLSNAAKFTQEGEIRVDAGLFTQKNEKWFRVSVHDTGIGMTPEQTEKVFNDFVQADSGTTKRFGGTGLGLSITRRLCELIGGHILVDSALGKGSTFTIELPVDSDGFLCALPV
jgi:signal transduction histidine kinase